MSHFGDLVRTLRKEKGLTLDVVARKIGSHKGYVSGIENDKVSPPSVKLIKKFAKLFGQDARMLARLAWVDKAPEILKSDAEEFLRWYQTYRKAESLPGAPNTSPSTLPVGSTISPQA